MVNELLLSIAILSASLESPNFHVRWEAKENLGKINNAWLISPLIMPKSLEGRYLKSLIEADRFIFDYREIENALESRGHIPIQGIRNVDIIDKDLYREVEEAKAWFSGLSASVKLYSSLLLRRGVNKERILLMIERANNYYERDHEPD